jgi:1,4-alpha-glucan branching enzyme
MGTVLVDEYMDTKIMRFSLVLALVILFSLFVTGCELRHPGPEVRRDGVYFSFYSPAAKSVVIAGSFNQWDVRKDSLAGPDKNGIWSIILPLPVGRYEYLYLEDGKEWKLDPGALPVDDGFGGKNSVVVIEK